MSSKPPHCATCQCETPAQRRSRLECEQREREREQREKEFIRRHSVLTNEDVAWARARIGSVTL